MPFSGVEDASDCQCGRGYAGGVAQAPAASWGWEFVLWWGAEADDL